MDLNLKIYWSSGATDVIADLKFLWAVNLYEISCREYNSFLIVLNVRLFFCLRNDWQYQT